MNEDLKNAFARGFLQGTVVVVTAYLVYFFTLCVAMGIAVWKAPKLLGIAFIGKASTAIVTLSAAAAFWMTIILGFFGKSLFQGIRIGVVMVINTVKAVYNFLASLFKKKSAKVFEMPNTSN